jgi:hypothetical protein
MQTLKTSRRSNRFIHTKNYQLRWNGPIARESQTSATQLSSKSSRAPVTHACNPSYSGGRDQEDCSSKPAQANSSWGPIKKKTITKAGGVIEGVGPKFKP